MTKQSRVLTPRFRSPSKAASLATMTEDRLMRLYSYSELIEDLDLEAWIS
jgi:hypothetical protein